MKVDSQHRIRLPLEVRSTVAWLNETPGTIECVATLGPSGGIQVEALAAYEHRRQPFLAALGDTLPKSTNSEEKWADAARLMATSWRLAIGIEANRISITLPEPIRRARQLPDVDGAVVVFGFGALLEVWDAGKWDDYVRGLAKSKASLVSQAIEDLEDR